MSITLTQSNFSDQARKFALALLNEIETAGIDLSNKQIDHICYRVESLERYTQMKEELSNFATALPEQEIAGRPIVIFRLQDPIEVGGKSVWLIELPAPKPTGGYKEGFQHFEVVIDEPFEDFIARYPDLAFKTSKMEKGDNPEISLTFSGRVVKFHHRPVDQVIATREANNTT